MSLRSALFVAWHLTFWVGYLYLFFYSIICNQ